MQETNSNTNPIFSSTYQIAEHGPFGGDRLYFYPQAYRLGMFGADYVWLLYGSVSERWWLRKPPTGCRAAELRAATAGLLMVDSFGETRPGARPASGLVRGGGRGERER